MVKTRLVRVGACAISMLAGVSALLGAPSVSYAEQFVLFDVTFTFTSARSVWSASASAVMITLSVSCASLSVASNRRTRLASILSPSEVTVPKDFAMIVTL